MQLQNSPKQRICTGRAVSTGLHQDAELENQIRAIRQRDKDFGYRRICGKLREYGILVNHKKVQRLVQKLSLQVKSFTNKSRKYNSYKGTCLDNSVMENFFGLLKQEMYYGRTYHSFEELECAIRRYIEYYGFYFVYLFNFILQLTVEKNEEEAVNWYRKAAEQGNADAQNSLGGCYYYGDGVEKNEEEAVNWYRKAAEQGYAVAQTNLANIYYYGKDVKENKEEAVNWFRKAAEQGEERAIKKLKEIDAHGQIHVAPVS